MWSIGLMFLSASEDSDVLCTLEAERLEQCALVKHFM